MAQDMDPQSILARSQAQTEASLRNVKKLNRRANLFAGLSAYDTFRRQQAIDRASNFYSVQSRRIEGVQNMFRDSINHWNTHIQDYGEGDWENNWWLKEADNWIKSRGYLEGSIDADDLINGVPARAYYADILKESDAGRQSRFNAYKKLHEAYSDSSLTALLNMSEQSQEQYIANYTAEEERELTKLTNQIGRQGGLLNDVRRVLGLGVDLQDVAYTARNNIRLPSGLAESTQAFLDDFLTKSDMRQSIDTLTGEYNATLGNSSLERLGITPRIISSASRVQMPTEFGNDTTLRSYTNKIQEVNANFFTADQWEGFNTATMGGGTINTSVPLMERDPDTGNLVPTSKDNEMIFQMAMDSDQDNAVAQMAETLNKNLNVAKNLFIQAATITRDDLGNEELANQFITTANDPILLHEAVASMMPYQLLYGIDEAGGGFTVTPLNEQGATQAYQLMLNTVRGITSTNEITDNMANNFSSLVTFREGSLLEGEDARLVMSILLGQDEEVPDITGGAEGQIQEGNVSSTSRMNISDLNSMFENREQELSNFSSLFTLSGNQLSSIDNISRLNDTDIQNFKDEVIGLKVDPILNTISNLPPNILTGSTGMINGASQNLETYLNNTIDSYARRYIRPKVESPEQKASRINEIKSLFKDYLISELNKDKENNLLFNNLPVSSIGGEAYNSVLDNIISILEF